MGRARWVSRLCVSFVVVLVGCGSNAVRVEPVRFEGWDAIELRSSSARLVVVPTIGRMMHFGRINGPNLLWVSREFAGKNPEEVTFWQNFGGDKVWPWPQSWWETIFGAGWPPPRTFDPGKYVVQELGEGRLRMASEPDPVTGYRVVRELELATDRACLRVLTRIERVTRPGDDPPALAAWVVTQIVTPDVVFIPVRGSATRPYEPMSPEPDPQFVLATPGGFRINPRPRAQKAGFDGDRLLATFGNERLVQRLVSVSGGAYLDPTHRAQVYAHKHDERGRTEYVELELTAPPGEVSELLVEWTIERAE